MSQTNEARKIIVIGGGPGGYAAAFLASDLGMEVSLVDPKANPGGVCLYHGCIPSKALLHVSRLILESQEAAAWGVTFAPPKIDIPTLRNWKNQVVSRLTSGLGELSKRRNITYINGLAQFKNAHTLQITLNDGQQSELNFEHAIIATGSTPSVIPGLDDVRPFVWNSTNALDCEEVPKRLLVIGGGYIGLELGSVYATLGSKVTVAEMMPTLLPGADSDLVRPLYRKLSTLFTKILLKTKVSSFQNQGRSVKVVFTDAAGDNSEAEFDKILIAVGRKPNTQGLGLETTRIQCNEQGFVPVDNQLRTVEPHIQAIGDIVGQPMLAHKASHEGRVAVEVLAGRNVVFEPQAIPAVVFTDPEIAWCGLSENEAKAKNKKVEVVRFPWAASGRAMTLERMEGLTKLLVDPENERILGMGIVGVNAGEMIAEGVLAMEMGAVATDLSLTIHPHPTLSETIMEAAEMYLGYSTHVFRPKRR